MCEVYNEMYHTNKVVKVYARFCTLAQSHDIVYAQSMKHAKKVQFIERSVFSWQIASGSCAIAACCIDLRSYTNDLCLL